MHVLLSVSAGYFDMNRTLLGESSIFYGDDLCRIPDSKLVYLAGYT